MVDIRILRYFLAVAQEESITRAAETLHIAQPSLSKQMMELEAELGKQLLIRGGRKIALTEDGILLRKRAEELIALFERTERELMADSRSVSGEVAIGGNTPASILKTAAAMRRKYPDVRFYFHSGDATDVEERMEHGSLDFAVMLHPVDNAEYNSIALTETVHWGLLVSRSSPLAAHEVITKELLLSAPVIFHHRPGLQRRIAAWAQTDVEKINIAATYNVINGSHEPFVRSGLGAFLTVRELLGSCLDENLRFCPLYPPLDERHVLVWRRNAMLSSAAKEFLNEVKMSALCEHSGDDNAV